MTERATLKLRHKRSVSVGPKSHEDFLKRMMGKTIVIGWYNTGSETASSVGKLVGYDKFTVTVSDEETDREVLVFKHAIRSIEEALG